MPVFIIKPGKFTKLILFILLCQLVGIFGSIFTVPAIPGWYENLIKPAFRPPNWLFGPVWVTLYTFMGIAVYLVWQKGIHKKSVRSSIYLFFIQLFFNAVWSVLFFGLRNPFLGLLDIILLWIMILVLIFKFAGLQKLAALLMLPYFIWVSFASFLNFSIWQLNR